MTDSEAPSTRRRLGTGQIVLVLAAVVVVGVALWLVLGGDDDEGANTGKQGAGARGVSVAQLQELAGKRGRPVFWAGPRRGSTYEYTETANGAAFVRYLAADAEIGDPEPSYLTVATYPSRNGYSRIVAASEREGAETEKLSNGGLAVVNRERPSSVYLAYPRGRYQVEVYDPSPARARELVVSGAVQPVR